MPRPPRRVDDTPCRRPPSPTNSEAAISRVLSSTERGERPDLMEASTPSPDLLRPDRSQVPPQPANYPATNPKPGRRRAPPTPTSEMGSRADDPIKIEDSESDSESDMPNQVQPVLQYIERGPLMLGDGPFDKHCVWGNKFRLDGYQCGYLNDLVDQYPRKPFKHYVYKMSNSSVIQTNCKMEFSPKFTERYLKRHLGDPLNIRVGCTTCNKSYKVRMMLSWDKKKAMLTSRWAKAVRRFSLEEDRIYIFTFRFGKAGNLKLLIDSLP